MNNKHTARLARLDDALTAARASNHEEQISNARLIAAAPDLLAALRRWDTFAKDNCYADKDFHDSDGTGWITATRNAIAKAEGHA